MQRGSSHRLVALAVAVVLSFALVPSAGAVTLMTIAGTVMDPLSRPLASVTVTDGRGKSVLTDSQGHYRIEESSLSTYNVLAYRTGLNSQGRSVDPVVALQPVDFTLTYALSGAVSPSVFNNDPPVALSVSATSWAPPAGQCVTFTDSTSGSQVALTFDSTNPDGSGRWVGSFTVPSGRSDASYTWQLGATNCAGITLTNSVSSSYLIDSVAPVIDGLSISPLDGGNTIFTSQPLIARITDAGGSGVKKSTVSFTLTNETAGSTTTLPAASLSPTTGWAKTSPASLVVGNVYRIALTASDYAGNTTTFAQRPASKGGGFLVTTIDAKAASATIPPVPCAVSDADLGTQTRTVTCADVTLHVAPTSVDLGGTRHGDRAFAEHAVSLDGAKVRGATPLEEQAAYPGQTRTVSLSYRVDGPTQQATSYPVAAKDVDLGTLVLTVPAYWVSSTATLEMSTVSTSASTAACLDPSVSTSVVPCLPDPLHDRYLVTLDEDVADVGAVVAEHASQLGAQSWFTYPPPAKKYAAWIPFASLGALAADPRVKAVARDFGIPRLAVAVDAVIDVTFDGAGSIVSRSDSGTYKLHDGNGVVVGYAPVPPASEQQGLIGNYTCASDGSGSSFFAYTPVPYVEPWPQTMDYQWFPFLRKHARPVTDPNTGLTYWSQQWEICANGGGDGGEGWALLLVGAGAAYDDGAMKRIGTKWKTGATPADYTLTLDFRVSAGPVSVGGTLSQTRGGEMSGSFNPPYGVAKMQDLSHNATNGWWEDDCWDPSFWAFNCLFKPGSDDFQGAVVHGLWELPDEGEPGAVDQPHFKLAPYRWWICDAVAQACPEKIFRWYGGPPA